MKILTLIFCVAVVSEVYSQPIPQHYEPLHSSDYVKDKNFYLLSLMEANTELAQLIREDSVLSGYTRSYKKSLERALQECQGKGSCLGKHLKYKEDDIKDVSKRLKILFQKNEHIQELVSDHLRPSGFYQSYAEEPDAAMLISSWELSARGINRIIQTYAQGEAGLYPAIDSVSFDIGSEFYQNLLQAGLYKQFEDTARYALFFQPSLYFALMLLEVNDRDEAASFEPLSRRENAAVVNQIPLISWENYPYSLILVPGHGPDQVGLQLSPLAKLRNDLAANRYREAKAPLIVVSGGYVHPFQTQFNEALEMKNDLINRLKIPATAILIEPHARHTTTNFRNTARLIYRYGIPDDKPALVTTTFRQSYYITEMGLDQRCINELGYVPYQIGKRLNVHDIVWFPQIESLQINPLDPLDP